jgi:prolyl 4-hydroxylase
LIIRRLAASGHAEALFTLADMYWRGDGIEQHYGKGRELIRRASEAGHPVAIRAYTNLLASGLAGPRDWPAALARLAAEARGDSRREQMLALIAAMGLTPDGDPRSLPPAEQLSESPHVLLFPGLFGAEECAFLALVAEPSYAPSLIADDNGPGLRDPIRTSDGATMHWLIEDPAIHALNRRLAAASGTDVSQGEPLQILRYRPGQQYRRHFDYQPGAANQRILTALVYLNDAYEGGETEFVRTGLRIRGEPGDGLVFRNTAANGRADEMAEHAGAPVTNGTKLLASRWIREKRHVP